MMGWRAQHTRLHTARDAGAWRHQPRQQFAHGVSGSQRDLLKKRQVDAARYPVDAERLLEQDSIVREPTPLPRARDVSEQLFAALLLQVLAQKRLKGRLEHAEARHPDYVNGEVRVFPLLLKGWLVHILRISMVDIRLFISVNLAFGLLKCRRSCFVEVPDEAQAIIQEVEEIHRATL